MSLESGDRVDSREGNEGECLLAKELDRVLSKGRRLIERFIVSFGGSLICSLLKRMFDVERLRGQRLGIINGVTDVDVVEKDILCHGPKLNTNATLIIFDEHGQVRKESKTHNLFKALYGCKIFKVIRIGDLAGGPLALVGRIVDQGGIPLALVEWIRLVRPIGWEF